MFSGNNGWGNQFGYLQQPNMQYTVVIDLAAVMQAHSQGMLLAYQMGRDARNLDNREEELQIEGKPRVDPAMGCYLGIFDKQSYGVYDNHWALENSEQYWHKETLKMEKFSTREEALFYARNGVAILRHVDVGDLQEMQHPINWRQKV